MREQYSGELRVFVGAVAEGVPRGSPLVYENVIMRRGIDLGTYTCMCSARVIILATDVVCME